MTLQEYHKWAISTRVYEGKVPMLIYATLKLCGEAGEFSEKVGKVLRDKEGIFSPDQKYELTKELGDVLWYLANCAQELGYSLEDVAGFNQVKINDRKARGVLKGSGDNR